jgi:hypothetical protein
MAYNMKDRVEEDNKTTKSMHPDLFIEIDEHLSLAALSS